MLKFKVKIKINQSDDIKIPLLILYLMVLT